MSTTMNNGNHVDYDNDGDGGCGGGGGGGDDGGGGGDENDDNDDDDLTEIIKTMTDDVDDDLTEPRLIKYYRYFTPSQP